MFAVEIYAAVRRFVFIEGKSQREAARVFGLSRDTIAKMCRYSAPPGYVRSKAPERPKLGLLVPVIDAILESDKTAPPKQRHTAKRIFERLRLEHGFAGGYTVVKDYVRIARSRSREVFVPLAHPPGHAQVDFGECFGVVGGVRMKLHVLCFDLPHSRCEYLIARDNVIALGNSGTGKTHACLALGLAACQRGFPVSFFTAAGLVHQLMEARDERRLLKLQAQLASVKLLIVDELGYVPLSQTGAELLFEIFSQRHERGSTIVTSNLPFEEWTSVFGNQRLTGALLDRLTHHVHILELNGESYRLKQSKARRRRALDPPMR